MTEWPADVPEPTFSQPRATLEMDDGCYGSRWPGGSPRLVARVDGGQLAAWLSLEEDGQAGYFFVAGPPWMGERYHRGGQMEDFSPWDDNSKPYPAEVTAEQWSAALMEQLTEELPGSSLSAEPLPREAPPRHAERPVSTEDVRLGELLPQLHDCPWHSPGQCFERLVNYFRWEPELARDVTNFGPTACLAARRGEGVEHFLTPRWEGAPGFQEQRLEDISIYRQIRQLALDSQAEAQKDRKHWTWTLSDVHPAVHRFEYEERVPTPVVWTLPSPDLGGFWMTQAYLATMLRHEASYGGALKPGGELRGGLAGAFLQAMPATQSWYYQPDSPGEPAELAELLTALDEPWREALERWAGAPGLTRWVNSNAENLREHLQAFQRGELPWDWRHSNKWQYDPGPAFPWREMAEDFAAGRQVAEILPGFRLNPFLARVERAVRHLKGEGREPELAAERTLSEEHRKLLFGVVGAPSQPGKGFVQLVAAAHWMLEADWDQPERFFFPSLRLVHWLLPTF